MTALPTTLTHVRVDVEPPFATVTMNRPERRNALSLEHMRELAGCLRSLGDDDRVSVVILRGEGPAFCAGHDLSEMVGRDADFYEVLFATCVDLMEVIQAIPQPVIAQVHGMATAAGCQLVATCDLAVASATATFATPGVRIGLFCSTPMVALTRAVGRKRALEMLLTGDVLDAEEARTAGLINRVAAPDDLGAATRRLAEAVVRASPRVVGLGKQAFYEQIELPQNAAYQLTRAVMVANARGADAQEGMAAFLEKRSPRWPHG